MTIYEYRNRTGLIIYSINPKLTKKFSTSFIGVPDQINTRTDTGMQYVFFTNLPKELYN